MNEIVCPTVDSVLHSPSGQHPVGAMFDCTGPTTMHCDSAAHEAVAAYSEYTLIECSPMTETLIVVPEPDLTLFLACGLIAVVILSFIKRHGQGR